MGGMVGFELKNAYKLQVATQKKTLGILRIEVLSSQAHMNPEIFEALVASLVFKKLPIGMQVLFSSIMPMPTETMSAREAMTAKGTTSEVVMAIEGFAPEV